MENIYCKNILEIIPTFLAGKIKMDKKAANDITNMVVSIQEKYGTWADIGLDEDIDSKRELLKSYEKYIGQEITFKKILEIAENFDIWCSIPRDRDFRNLDAQIHFIYSMVELFSKN